MHTGAAHVKHPKKQNLEQCICIAIEHARVSSANFIDSKWLDRH